MHFRICLLLVGISHCCLPFEPAYFSIICEDRVPGALTLIKSPSSKMLSDSAMIFMVTFLIQFWETIAETDQSNILGEVLNNIVNATESTKNDIMNYLEQTVTKGGESTESFYKAVFLIAQRIDDQNQSASFAFVRIAIRLLKDKFEWCMQSGKVSNVLLILVRQISISETQDLTRECIRTLSDPRISQLWPQMIDSNLIQELVARVWFCICSRMMDSAINALSSLLYLILLTKRTDFLQGMAMVCKADFERALVASQVTDAKAFDASC